jgi:uncharacterized protein with HEPN domain
MSRRDDLVRLRDMLDHARMAVQFVESRTQRDLESDRMLALACLRALEIVGEAASRISPEFRNAHPEFSWRDMIAMRNRLIHAYASIDFVVIWTTIVNDMPPLIAALEPLMPPDEPPRAP